MQADAVSVLGIRRTSQTGATYFKSTPHKVGTAQTIEEKVNGDQSSSEVYRQ
jgi:hypothetical protein